MKLNIFFISLLFTLTAYSEICRLQDINGETIRILGQSNSCELDLEAGGAALINSINKKNLSENTPSTTEKNTSNIMLNYVTKNLVNISQLNKLTTSFGSPINPTGELAQSCTLDQINNLGEASSCKDKFSPERIKELFGKSIEEVVSEHFVGELMKTENNTDQMNNVNQCLSSRDASMIGQQSRRMDLFSNIMMMASMHQWDDENNRFLDNSLNVQLESDPHAFIEGALALSPNDPNLPFLTAALKDKNGVTSFFQAISKFKKNNPNADLLKREDSWSFYQTLFRDSDLISNMRGALADQCKNLFSNFTNFICNPITFHATNNRIFNDRYGDIKNENDLTDSFDNNNANHYMEYLYNCQGKHCFQEDQSLVNAKFCKGSDNEDGFNLNLFLEQVESYDALAIGETNNQIYRDTNIYGRTSRESQDEGSPEMMVCSNICENQPKCSPRKTAEQIRNDLKCGQADESSKCSPALKAWLEMQEMQTSYDKVIAERNSSNKTEGEESTDEATTRLAAHSDFMSHFLGQIGQDVMAGKTPTLSGIVKPTDRTKLTEETLADAAEGTSDFDTPERTETRTIRGKTLTETLAEIQQKGGSGNLNTNAEAINKGIASAASTIPQQSFSPLRPGSLGSQMASAIPSRDRNAFINENAQLMRDILKGQSDDVRGNLNTLDKVLANNERQFNNGVNVNNSFEMPKTRPDGSRSNTRPSADFGFGVNGGPVNAPGQGAPAPEEEPMIGVAKKGSSKAQTRSAGGSRGPASAGGGTSGPSQSGPTYAATIENLETITLEELQSQNIPLDKPFILVINAGNKSVSVRVVPMQHRGETILAPDISGIGEDEYFVYPLLKKATVFQKFFAYREERLNSIRSI